MTWIWIFGCKEKEWARLYRKGVFNGKNTFSIICWARGFYNRWKQSAGFETVFANDFEPSCVETLKETFPKIRISGTDITKLSVSEELHDIGPIDLLTGGFPCQSFSGAGSNLGFDDPRGQLFEIIRICKELPEPPKVLLLENVSFLKRFDNGVKIEHCPASLKEGWILGE